MGTETQIETVERLLQPLLTDDIFLVSIRVKPVNNIKIYLDADNGLGIEKCIKINRALYKIMEEMGIYPDGNYSLEVSSPGIDEPLKLQRQYVKNIGRSVEITRNDDIKFEGVLKGVTDDAVEVETTTGKGKKLVVETVSFPWTDIKQTKVLIKF